MCDLKKSLPTVKKVSSQLSGGRFDASVASRMPNQRDESMCGIVGLFLKDPKLEPQLGAMLTDMLITMTDRGPDSAGIAIYGRAKDGLGKMTVQSATPMPISRTSLTATCMTPSASR
jgi:hypothetical protein